MTTYYITSVRVTNADGVTTKTNYKEPVTVSCLEKFRSTFDGINVLFEYYEKEN